jgi:hypothetical protein
MRKSNIRWMFYNAFSSALFPVTVVIIFFLIGFSLIYLGHIIPAVIWLGWGIYGSLMVGIIDKSVKNALICFPIWILFYSFDYIAEEILKP